VGCGDNHAEFLVHEGRIQFGFFSFSSIFLPLFTRVNGISQVFPAGYALAGMVHMQISFYGILVSCTVYSTWFQLLF
jgi:hypothetical protein